MESDVVSTASKDTAAGWERESHRGTKQFQFYLLLPHLLPTTMPGSSEELPGAGWLAGWGGAAPSATRASSICVARYE